MVKKPELRTELGKMMVPILVGMTARGPDSAGLAVFTDPVPGSGRKYSLYADGRAGGSDFNWGGLHHDFGAHLGVESQVQAHGNHAVLATTLEPKAVRVWLAEHYPQLHLLSAGRAMDLYKDVGTPRQVADRYGFARFAGTHVVGHTRMATESAVTPDRAHPFTAGEDFCLVHNGTISNPFQIRRQLEHRGIRFQTDNDTEAACRFLEWRMREGDDLESALQQGFEVFDGFYTLLMGTGDKLALVRDAFSCKPAVVVETDDYVAISSEFHALAHLPDVTNARIFEPAPEEIYSWTI
jgi:amidophosphoribosyltransferase